MHKNGCTAMKGHNRNRESKDDYLGKERGERPFFSTTDCAILCEFPCLQDETI
jgi:hypothetical protein